MEIASEFAPFQERVQAALVKAARKANDISSEDLPFYRSSSSSVSESLDSQSFRLLELTNSLLKVAASSSEARAPSLHNVDGVDENWRAVVDVIDELLEKADACLDEFTGVVKKVTPSQQEQNIPQNKKSSATRFPGAYDFQSARIAKPQLSFERPADNADTSPFKPLLRSKPHAMVPLRNESADRKSSEHFGHPYDVEIMNSKYPEFAYSVTTPEMFKPFDSTTAMFVDTLDGVKSMLEELKGAKEIAVDLEHHDAHSYHGIVCLMQISTRDSDWIVDTLKPWREELQILNEVFADPAILKVFHGSSMDIIWLQRDLGLYIVGLFDTYHASVALAYPKRSLKFLLEKFVNFQAEKKYQMADWRLRPLLPGMFDYARSDTHYLLYIYDHLRNELLQNSTPDGNLIDYVLEKSKEEALQRFERPAYNAATGEGSGGWLDLLTRSAVLFSKEQFAVFKAVHQWRDKTARAEDEGVQYVLSKQALFRIAHAMPLDQVSLMRTISYPSPVVRVHASELVGVIKKAKEAGMIGPELRDVLYPAKQAISEDAPIAQILPAARAEAQATVTRSELSQFWGPAIKQAESEVSPLYALSASTEASQMSLPLPSTPMKLSESIHLGKGDDDVTLQPTSEETVAAGSTAKNEPTNEVFTVKQYGVPKKRKISPADTTAMDDTPIPTESSAFDDLTSSSVSTPKENKPKKSKNKKQKTEKEHKESDVIPFDYANAETVLHAQPAVGQSMPQTKQFNPYSKAMDAPKGMRKSKKTIEGKSFTFRK